MDPTLDALYRQHQQGLYSFALCITRCGQRAEDAVHEVFMRLLERRRIPTGDSVAYLFRAVRNAAIDQVRAAKTQSLEQSPLSIFQEQSADPQALAVERELGQAMRCAMDELDVDQKELIVLRVYAGLTFEQMASAQSAPLQTVVSRYRRAIEDLKGKMRW